MRSFVSFCRVPLVLTTLLLGCDRDRPLDAPLGPEDRSIDESARSSVATLVKLPSLGSNSEAWGIDEAGLTVVGQAFDRAGYLYAVRWRLQNGSWTISVLPYPATAATAKGVSNGGDIVGYRATSPTKALLWPPGGGAVGLGCATDPSRGEAHAISADGQLAVGWNGPISDRSAVVWRPGQCGERLPPLVPGFYSRALAASGSGMIVGGLAARDSTTGGRPVRWRQSGAVWQAEQLDVRPGVVHGANGFGDLAGSVRFPVSPCVDDPSATGCTRAVIWYADGSSRELNPPVAGGDSWINDINAGGEAVGVATWNAGKSAFFWSQSMGMIKLPTKASNASAFAVSNVRSDGTRVVAGSQGGNAVVWIVRNP